MAKLSESMLSSRKTPPAQELTRPRPPRRSRWLVRVVVAGGLLGCLIIAALILWSGRLLVSTPTSLEPDAMLLVSGDRMVERASEWVKLRKQNLVLLPGMLMNRLESMQIIPDRLSLLYKSLEKQKVPSEQIVLLQGEAGSDFELLQKVDTWLESHPDKRVSLLCDEFSSARWELLVERSGGKHRRRIQIQPLRDRRYSPTTWWQTRPGIRAWALSFIQLGVTWERGSVATPDEDEWSPDEYEVALTAGPGGTPQLPPRPTGGRLVGLANWLDCGQVPEPVDYLLLLPGDENSRPFVAAALYKAGLVKEIVFPRNFATPQQLEGLAPPTHEVIQKVLRARGVPDEAILIPDRPSDSTMDDGLSVKAMLMVKPDAKVGVVTSFYHLRRSRMVLRSIYGERADSFVYIAAPATGYSAGRWFESDAGTISIVSEYFKLGIYWFWYGPGKYWSLAFCVVSIGLVWQVKKRLSRRRLASPKAALAV